MDPLSRGRNTIETSGADSNIDSPVKRPRIASIQESREKIWPGSSTPIHQNVLNISDIASDLLETYSELKDDKGHLQGDVIAGAHQNDCGISASNSTNRINGVAISGEEIDRKVCDRDIHAKIQKDVDGPNIDGEAEVDMMMEGGDWDIAADCQEMNGRLAEAQLSIGTENSVEENGEIARSYRIGHNVERRRGRYERVEIKRAEKSVKVKLERGESGEVELERGESGEVEVERGESGEVKLERGECGEVEVERGESCEVKLERGESGEVKVEIGQSGEVKVERGESVEVEVERGESKKGENEIDGGCPLQKRKSEKQNWVRNQYKSQREKGQAYTGGSKTSDKAEARSPGEGCSCSKSTYRCEDFTDDDRRKIFENVWSLTREQKRTFVMSFTENGDVARRTIAPATESHSQAFRKQNSFTYYLKGPGGQRMKVCRRFFLSTTGLRKWCVWDWIVNEKAKDVPIAKAPSRHEHDRNFCVENFFNVLPRLPSHYCKASSTKLYLEPIFQSFADVYRLYTSKCAEHHRSILSRQVVKDIFDKTNLSIFSPRKDQCDICVGHSSGNVDDGQWLIHRQLEDDAQNSKSADKEEAIRSLDSSDRILVCCMDLQAVLLTPRLKASALYYKSKLCVHHFTVYNMANRDVQSYVWHEGEGGVTSNELASCIIHFLEENLGFRKCILFSDGCTNQNRNSTLSKALLHFSMKKHVQIEQKFLEKGHAQMEVDSVHSCVERQLKDASVYVPAQYVERIQSARSNTRPYRVKYVQHEFFQNFTQTCNLESLCPGRKVVDPSVIDVRCLLYSPSGTISYKLSHGTEEHQLLPKVRKHHDVILQDPTPLYLGPRKIEKDKYLDLQSLKTVMPIDYHSFYDNLLTY